MSEQIAELGDGEDPHNYTELPQLPPFFLNWIDRNSNNIIGIWDKQEKLLFVTKSVISILGYQPSELLGDSWKQLISKEDMGELYRDTGNGFGNKNAHITISNYDEMSIQFEYTLETIIDERNDTTYFIGVFKNIPNQKKTEEMIVKSEKMSVAGQLAAGIAHEIRNPLTSLKGFLQLLQAGVSQKEVYYQVMVEEIEKIEMITSELLFISKPLTDEKKKESVSSMIKDVVVLLGSQARLKNIRIEWSVCEEYYIYCNRSQIKQVLINIIKNAIEAMEKTGIIKIIVRLTKNNRIEIDIIDEGPGIPEKDIDKIGEPFFTTKLSGTGLGLMITKQILEKQHGRIRVAKSNESGSTFRITLPRA